MNDIEKLAGYFAAFPGIGNRQAKRLAYFLLSKDARFVKDLTESILSAKEHTMQCSSCHRFCASSPDEKKGSLLCDMCRDPHANKEILMVVEKDVDLENIRKIGIFDGLFFVLGGSVPLLDKTPAEKIRARELFERVRAGIKNGMKEVVLALSVTPEGENTALYISKILDPLSQKSGIKISTLGRGLSTGTELEYSDSDTLRNALKNRG